MYRIIDNRDSGKTARLMLLAKENNGLIVCSNPEAKRVKAYNYGLTGIDFISYQDFLEADFISDKEVYIDEMEVFMKFICNSLSGYTLSNED